MKVPRIVVVAAGLVMAGGGSAAAQDAVEALRNELGALKADYESRIQDLEERIQDLETPPPVRAPDPTPAEDMVRLQEQVDRAAVDFDFRGYMRSGFGSDGKGGAQTAFRAPNAGATYRLGNEAETYAETTFVTSTPPEEAGGDPVYFETLFTLAYVTPTSNNDRFDATTSMREAYAAATGVVPANPTTSFWAGERFYSRYDVHMNDYYYRDMSGYGGGIEHVSLFDGRAMFAAAWLGGSIDDLSSNGTPIAEGDIQFKKNSLDLSLYAIPAPGGTLALHGTYADFDGDRIEYENGEDPVLVKDADGWALNLIFDSAVTETVQNRFVAQYGTGAAYNFKTQMLLPAGYDRSQSGTVDVNDLVTWRVLNQVVVDGEGPMSLLGLALYEDSDYGTDTLDRVQWGSFGLRPAYHFNRYYSLAAEFGYDHTSQEDGLEGALYKITLAPQVTPQASPLSRPSVRAFLTYAWWDDDFVGSVGTPSFANDNEGLAVGMQLETWW